MEGKDKASPDSIKEAFDSQYRMCNQRFLNIEGTVGEIKETQGKHGEILMQIREKVFNGFVEKVNNIEENFDIKIRAIEKRIDRRFAIEITFGGILLAGGISLMVAFL